MGALTIATIMFLLILTGLAIWSFAVADLYGSYAKTTSVTRGLTGEAGDTVVLSCPGGRVISVDSATQTCTNPDSNGFENSTTDAMTSTTQGSFDPNTTVDLTSEIGGEANGETNYSYSFNPLNPYTPQSGGSSVSCGGTIQLIGTYTCSTPK